MQYLSTQEQESPSPWRRDMVDVLILAAVLVVMMLILLL
jgi:hypothetical protein